MNAKCAAAANKMLNEVELTGTWLLELVHWCTTEPMAYKLNVCYLFRLHRGSGGMAVNCAAVCKAVKLIEPTTK